MEELELELKQLHKSIRIIIAMRALMCFFILLFIFSCYLIHLEKIPIYWLFISFIPVKIFGILGGLSTGRGMRPVFEDLNMKATKRRINKIEDRIQAMKDFAQRF